MDDDPPAAKMCALRYDFPRVRRRLDASAALVDALCSLIGAPLPDGYERVGERP